jgi:NDP-sugar pyrophosphorylase family protein
MSEMLPVVILAGGLARRLWPLTARIPKALVDVAGEPFLAHQLRLLRSHGIAEVVICAGHLGDRIAQFAGDGSAWGLRVQYSSDGDRLLGTAGAICKALPLLGEAFFVIYGDSYLPCDYAAAQKAFQSSGKLALMTVCENRDRWDASNVEFADGRILAYSKTCKTAAMRHIDYGLGVIRREAFDEAPPASPYDLAELYRQLLDRGELAALDVRQRFYEIGSFQGLEEMRRLLGGGTVQGGTVGLHSPIPA